MSTIRVNKIEPLSNDTVEVSVKNSVKVINTISDLLLEEGTTDYLIYVKGYNTINDGGGGEFYFDASKSYINDSGLCFNGWVRILNNNIITPEMFGADRTGQTECTQQTQTCIDVGKSSAKTIGLTGVYLVGPLKLNGGTYTGPTNNQWSSISGFRGIGRNLFLCGLKAAPGLYNPGDFVLTGRNLAGVEICGFYIDGNSVADSGLNLSWVGGSSGNPSIAPSNQCSLHDINIKGCVSIGAKLYQFNDSPIDKVWVSGVAQNSPAFSLQGSGGQLIMSSCYASSGYIDVSCQNSGFQNCGFFGGIVLSGAGYNTCHFDSCHIYPNSGDVTPYLINSSAIGNGSRSIKFTSCYFNNTTGNVIRGRFNVGVIFEACQFNGWASMAFFGPITNAYGTNRAVVPKFKFINSFFNISDPNEIPKRVASQLEVLIDGCHYGLGKIERYDGCFWSDSSNIGPIKSIYSISATNGTWYPFVADITIIRGVGNIFIAGTGNNQPILSATFGRTSTNTAADQIVQHCAGSTTTGEHIETRWNASGVPEFRITGGTLSYTLRIAVEYMYT